MSVLIFDKDAISESLKEIGFDVDAQTYDKGVIVSLNRYL
jgi:hypothetical protein